VRLGLFAFDRGAPLGQWVFTRRIKRRCATCERLCGGLIESAAHWLNRVCAPLVIREADQLRLDPKLWVDVTDLAEHCQQLIQAPPLIDPQEAWPLLAEAVLLPTWSDCWLIAERERLRLLRLQAWSGQRPGWHV
jgi:hypothetical protein